MESILAEIILSGNLYKRSDFVTLVCNKLDYNLLKYNDLYEKIKKSDKGFWAKELDYEDYLLSKDKINDMIILKDLIFEKDYIFSIDLNEDLNIYQKYLYFSTSGIMKCMSNSTELYLENIAYINRKYKYYLDELHFINIHINLVEL
jgi:hypothetical protein